MGAVKAVFASSLKRRRNYWLCSSAAPEGGLPTTTYIFLGVVLMFTSGTLQIRSKVDTMFHSDGLRWHAVDQWPTQPQGIAWLYLFRCVLI